MHCCVVLAVSHDQASWSEHAIRLLLCLVSLIAVSLIVYCVLLKLQGKTAQAICFLGVLKAVELDPGPHLIVVPASLLENW